MSENNAAPVESISAGAFFYYVFLVVNIKTLQILPLALYSYCDDSSYILMG